jgi:hypothetical protein
MFLTRTGSLFLLALFVVSAAFSPMVPGCGFGCFDNLVPPATSISEVYWEVDVPLDTSPGLCYYSCQTDPCLVDGRLRLVNDTSSVPVYMRGSLNGICVPGTITVPAGGESDWIAFDGLEIACGTTYRVSVYTTDPGSGCPQGGAFASFSFSCTGCQAPPN